MMAERHRLAALQVGVAGKQRVGLRLGEREHDERERLDLPSRLGAGVEHVEPERRRDLVVARAAGMDLPAEVAELPLDRAVHVLVLGEVAGRVERDLGEPRPRPRRARRPRAGRRRGAAGRAGGSPRSRTAGARRRRRGGRPRPKGRASRRPGPTRASRRDSVGEVRRRARPAARVPSSRPSPR